MLVLFCYSVFFVFVSTVDVVIVVVVVDDVIFVIVVVAVVVVVVFVVCTVDEVVVVESLSGCSCSDMTRIIKTLSITTLSIT